MTGTPGGRAGNHVPPAAAAPAPAPTPAATPVPTRLRRLAQVVERSRRSRSDRDIRKIMQILGMLAIGVGFACILMGWYGASHSPFLYQEIPYLISGGLLGLALVIGGGVLVRCAWSLRQVEEARRNAVAIVRSVDRLERVLRSLEERRADELRHEDLRHEELTPWN